MRSPACPYVLLYGALICALSSIHARPVRELKECKVVTEGGAASPQDDDEPKPPSTETRIELTEALGFLLTAYNQEGGRGRGMSCAEVAKKLDTVSLPNLVKKTLEQSKGAFAERFNRAAEAREKTEEKFRTIFSRLLAHDEKAKEKLISLFEEFGTGRTRFARTGTLNSIYGALYQQLEPEFKKAVDTPKVEELRKAERGRLDRKSAELSKQIQAIEAELKKPGNEENETLTEELDQLKSDQFLNDGSQERLYRLLDRGFFSRTQDGLLINLRTVVGSKRGKHPLEEEVDRIIRSDAKLEARLKDIQELADLANRWESENQAVEDALTDERSRGRSHADLAQVASLSAAASLNYAITLTPNGKDCDFTGIGLYQGKPKADAGGLRVRFVEVDPEMSSSEQRKHVQKELSSTLADAKLVPYAALVCQTKSAPGGGAPKREGETH